jgi:hypothetical protein
MVGATDEDSAKALAERIRNEAPAGSQVKVEGTWRGLRLALAEPARGAGWARRLRAGAAEQMLVVHASRLVV